MKRTAPTTKTTRYEVRMCTSDPDWLGELLGTYRDGDAAQRAAAAWEQAYGEPVYIYTR